MVNGAKQNDRPDNTNSYRDVPRICRIDGSRALGIRRRRHRQRGGDQQATGV